MNLIEFVKNFPDEESYKRKWREIRERQGVVCPKCGCREHYWKNDKQSFECKHCGHRQSLKANTIMHGSQLPFRYWFITMHLLTSTKKSFSASEIQRQLGHKYYEPIWSMVHKLRDAMGKRDDRYMLDGEIEIDEGFFTVDVEESDKDRKKGLKDRKVGHIKMKVVGNLGAATIDGKVKQFVSGESVIDSDDSTSYVNLKDIVKEHHPQVIPKKETGKVLPWVHIAISNAKRLLLDIHHAISPEHLQSYLNEFCYKFNRRYFGDRLFDRLLVASVIVKNEFSCRIR